MIQMKRFVVRLLVTFFALVTALVALVVILLAPSTQTLRADV